MWFVIAAIGIHAEQRAFLFLVHPFSLLKRRWIKREREREKREEREGEKERGKERERERQTDRERDRERVGAC